MPDAAGIAYLTSNDRHTQAQSGTVVRGPGGLGEGPDNARSRLMPCHGSVIRRALTLQGVEGRDGTVDVPPGDQGSHDAEAKGPQYNGHPTAPIARRAFAGRKIVNLAERVGRDHVEADGHAQNAREAEQQPGRSLCACSSASG